MNLILLVPLSLTIALSMEYNVMAKVKIEMTFMADLDPVEGTWHEPEDYVQFVRKVLTESHPHYNASVSISKVESTQWHSVGTSSCDMPSKVKRPIMSVE